MSDSPRPIRAERIGHWRIIRSMCTWVRWTRSSQCGTPRITEPMVSVVISHVHALSVDTLAAQTTQATEKTTTIPR
jgi:hypothetical protein